MKKEYSALDLFGGRGAVVKKMSSILKRDLVGIMKLDEGDRIRWFEEAGFDTPELRDKVYRVIRGQKEDCYTIRMIGESLGIDIDDAFDKPKFTAESRLYWLSQITENPMVIGGNPPKNSGKNNLGYQKAELRFYVKLRAISEFVRDDTKAAMVA